MKFTTVCKVAATLIVLTMSTRVQADPGWLKDLDQRYVLKSELAYSLDEKRRQKTELTLRANIDTKLGGFGRLSGIGLLRLDPTDKLEPGAPDASQDVRSGATRRALLGTEGDFELRELFLDKFFGETFVRLGKQQIVWGEADGIRVLDTLNPVHFREFILPDSQDRRIPVWMAQAEMPVGSSSLQFVWIPDHTYDDPAPAGSPFAITSPRFVPQLPPGQQNRVPVVLESPRRPDSFFKDDNFGLRLLGFKSGWDFSLNYLYHYSGQPALYRSSTPDGIVLTPQYERTHLVGGTFSRAFDSVTLRGEIAYSTDKYFLTTNQSDSDGNFNTPEFSYVVGLDYQHNADLFISGQVFQSVLTDIADGATRDKTDTTLSLRIDQDYFNDRVKLSALALYNANDSDGMLHLGVNYQWRTNVTLSAGIDLFSGNRRGLYGQFGDADRVGVGFEIEL